MDKRKRDELCEYIWNNYSKKISFFISNIVAFNNPHFEDLLQDIMLKTFINLEKYNPLYSFDTWIYAIARNHCINFVKIAQRYTSLEDYHDIHSDNCKHETSLEETEVFNKITEVLKTLKPLERQIVFLKFYEDLKYANISEILDINVNTIKTMVRRLKEKLSLDLKDFV